MPVKGKGAVCNTPPQNTEGDQEGIKKPDSNQIVVDWLEFTMPLEFMQNQRFKSLATYLNIVGAKFTHAPRGMNGYSKQMLYGGARILYGGNDDMGVHVILSGSVLRAASGCPLSLLHWLLHHGGRVSRIDIALDEVNGALKFHKMEKCIAYDYLVCQGRECRIMESGKLGRWYETLSKTLYFGSAKSRTQYRIYDKAKESNVEGPWVRVEGQYRNENAHVVALQVHDAQFDLGSVFTGLLRGYLRFLKPSKLDSNKSRWAVVDWWEKLLINTQALKLAVQKAKPSMDRALSWFKRQVAPSFAMMLQYYGAEKMREVTRLGWERLTEEQKSFCHVPF